MTLCHARIARRLGLKVSTKKREQFELYDALGKSMKFEGTSVISVIPEGCTKPRRLKC